MIGAWIHVNTGTADEEIGKLLSCVACTYVVDSLFVNYQDTHLQVRAREDLTELDEIVSFIESLVPGYKVTITHMRYPL